MSIDIAQFIVMTDNFGVLVHEPSSGETASIDAPYGAAIAAEAERRGWPLTHLLLTHHHLDHIEGASILKERFPQMKIIGAKKDAHRLPPLDIAVSDGDVVPLGRARARVIETPGHTLGHVAYYFEEDEVIFVGDTLFSLGCGRVFEGTMAMMLDSLEKLASLPGETRVYCGHEYTQANGLFAITVDPQNDLLKERLTEVEALRAAGKYTLPTTIAREKATNPFLRTEEPGVAHAMGMDDSDSVAIFAEMRERKNRFPA